jgi:hypothetical protein
MIVGLILVGSVIGAVAALGALVLGQGVLMALLIYSGTGCACVLALALRVALRPDPAPDTETVPPTRLQRG